MKPSSPAVHISIALPASDYAAYRAAVRRLSREMGSQAPTVTDLLTHTLIRRDSTGLAEDYLESVDWPVKPARKGRKSRPKMGAR